MAKDRFGLRELERDDRDFQLGAMFFLPDLKELPEAFELETLSIKNQGNTDFCSAYASCGLSELQEGVELYPEFSFACSKAISGNVDQWGQDLRSALKAHQKYGGLALKDTPEALKSLSNDEKRYLHNYPPEVEDKALEHKKQSYFRITGQYDSYDNIRASIWKFREKKQAVEVGIIFGYPLTQYKLDTVVDNGFGHAMYITGWNEEGLVIVNSYGTEAGKQGKHIITREVINQFADRFGAFMMVDIEPESVKTQMERKAWTTASWYGKILLTIKKLTSWIFKRG